jgi:hypothetical protein
MEKHCNMKMLRHRLHLERLVLTADGLGGFTSSWSPFLTFWAAVEPMPHYRRSHFLGKLVGQEPIEAYYALTFRGSPKKDRILSAWQPPLRLTWGEEILKPLSMPSLDNSSRWWRVIAISALLNLDEKVDFYDSLSDH